MDEIDYKKLVGEIREEIDRRVYAMEHGNSVTIDDIKDDIRMEALRSILKFIDDRTESTRPEPEKEHKWRFKKGDRLYSKNNPRLTYIVLDTGLNELGHMDYEVEIFLDGYAGTPRNIQHIECRKMDTWAEHIEQQ